MTSFPGYLSTAIPAYTVTIGSTDVTECLRSLRLLHPDIDIATPQACTGTIELRDTYPLQAFSLDPRVNTDLRRQSIVTVQVGGITVLTGYLRRYRYWDGKGKGDLIDALGLIDVDRAEFEVPDINIAGGALPNDLAKRVQDSYRDSLKISEDLYPEIAASEGTSISSLVRTLLLEAGKDANGDAVFTNVGSFDLTGSIAVPYTTRDPVGEAQKFCGVDRQWLYADATGAITSQEYPDRGGGPVVRLSLREVLAFEPDPTQDLPEADKVVVYGARDVPYLPVEPNEEEEDDAGLLEEEGETYYDEGYPTLIVTETRGPRATLGGGIPWGGDEEKYPGCGSTFRSLGSEEIVVEVKKIRYYYESNDETDDPNDKTLVKTVTEYWRPPLLLYPRFQEFYEELNQEQYGDPYYYPSYVGAGALALTGQVRKLVERVTEEPTVKTTERATGYLFPDTANPYDTSTLWEKLIVWAEEEVSDKTKRKIKNEAGGGQTADEAAEEALRDNVEPPQQSEYEILTLTITGEAEIDFDGWTPAYKVPLLENVGWLYDKAQADRLAEWWARFLVQSANAWFVSVPPIPPLLARFKEPFVIADVHHRRLILTAAELVIEADGEQSSCRLNYTAREYGAITPIPEPAMPTPFIPSGALEVVPLPAQSYTVGMVIADLQLHAVGGTEPYTWSATGLPGGLSLSVGGVLSGTPISAGSSTATITVTDAAANSDNLSLSIAVAALPSAVPLERPTSPMRIDLSGLRVRLRSEALPQSDMAIDLSSFTITLDSQEA